MAKESTSTRIPRLDGISRIPLPGSITRQPTALRAPTQILRPPTTYGIQRTVTTGIRAPLLGANALKKSSSGERLNNAVNLMSKKTSTAFKKFFGKPEKLTSQQQLQTPTRKPIEKYVDTPHLLTGKTKMSMVASTPHPLTRSDTFVRSDTDVAMLGITQNVLAQSTPAPKISKITASENTHLMGNHTRHALYTTQSLDATQSAAQFGETIVFEHVKPLQRTMTLDNTRTSVQGFGNTIDIDSSLSATQKFGSTISVDSPVEMKMSITQTLSTPTVNLTKNSHGILGETVCVNTPSEDLQKQMMGNTIPLNTPYHANSLNGSQLIDKLTNVDLTQTLKSSTTRCIDSADMASPATNATYSNPGSTDNLQMLADISLPLVYEMDVTLQPAPVLSKTYKNLFELTDMSNMDTTLTALALDKANMKLPLNSTMNTERLLELTTNDNSPARHMQLLNLTKDYVDTPRNANNRNNTQLLYMTPISNSASTTPDRNTKFGHSCAAAGGGYQHTPLPAHLLSPMYLKSAQSDLVLPTRTPDDDLLGESMDVDITLGARTEEFYAHAQQQGVAVSLQDVNNPNSKQKSRFSFGLDLTESTLDCSIELVDISLSSTVLSQPNANSVLGHNMSQSPSSQQLHQQHSLKKQNSFEMDESLGILTPDQMKEFLDSANTNTNNLELPLGLNSNNNNKLSLHQMRMDQTPSPEELPLDPVEVKTDITDMILAQQQQHQAAFSAAQQRQQMQQQQQLQNSISTEPVSQHTDTELSKTEPMTKSSVSKISTSFITSVTSVTSLDTGYQGDGEMSRPASRGACDHSPSNGPAARKCGHVSRQPSFNNQQQQQQQQQMPPIRRQDPMTDSDFFTESDADDIFHRGDRRAQVIDGQLYGPMLQPSTSVFISEDPQMEDSCMESSGIFTDVENRCDEDLAQMRRQDTQDALDLSPDGDGDESTETVKSNRESGKYMHAMNESENTASNGDANAPTTALGQGHLSCSQTSSTIHSSFSTDRLSSAATTLSNRTSYCSVDGSAVHVDGKSFSSLEEAFDECVVSAADARAIATSNDTTTLCGVGGGVKRTKSSTGTGNTDSGEPKQLLSSLTVQRVSSPRKHASLTSLCNANSAHSAGAKSEIGSLSAFSNVPSSPGTRSESGTNAVSKVSVCSDSVKIVSSNKYTPRALSKTTPQKSAKLRSTTTTSVNTTATNSSALVRKSHTTNKWDAVMDKIANNKVHMKKNYNDVKSKVSTRSSMTTGGGSAAGGNTPNSVTTTSSSPIARRSPSSVCSAGPTSPSLVKVLNSSSKSTTASSPQQPTDIGSGALQSLQAKRLLQAAAKRGRSYSKDSQKSSQSDLSLTSGSPKLLAKTPLRAAKKRDVRNLSISPTDLGPPPKTQQTANGTSTRPKPTAVTLTQKRFTPNGQPNGQSVSTSPSASSTAASTPTNGCGSSPKGSPPAKKHNILNRRLEIKTPVKTTLRDHNRIIGSTQSISTTATQPLKHGSKSETPPPTELHDISNGTLHHNNNNVTTTTTTTDKLSSTTNTPRTSSQNSSPILAQHGKKISTTAASTPLEKKTQSKLQTSRKLLHQKQHQRSAEEATPTVATPPTEYLDPAELQQLKLLNRHSCNGRLDYAALEAHLQQAERVKQQQDKGVEALGVLLQYLVYDLDAFACPSAKKDSGKAKENLSKTLQLLDEAKHVCTELQDQLCDKEAYFTQREEELQALHRCELEKAQSNLSDIQTFAKEQQYALQEKLTAKDAETKRALDCYRLEMENKFAQKQQLQLAAEERERELQERLNTIEISELELREQLSKKDQTYSAHMKAAAERDQEQNERIKLLSKELNGLREIKDASERALRDQLNLSQDEISVLRTSRKSLNESVERGASPRNSNASLEITRLQSEAESLRCVLELKQKEISKLTKHNEELIRDADERVAFQGKISLLESRNEMLQSELAIKSDKEKEFLRQIDDIQKAFNHETVKRTRLSYDNEALQWQLKQRSEQLHIVEAKLQELSAHESSLNTTNHSSYNGAANRYSHSQINGSSLVNIQMEDISPPTSPVIKGVIEKTDSVSWVLEMDDETPEAAASKMVKRAGSFRSVERSPSTRRQLSVSASAACSSQTLNSFCGAATAGPNPLSQSMSATSVIRQHSSDAVAEFANRSHARTRSKSVSVKITEPVTTSAATKSSGKKLSRQNSAGSSRKHELVPTSWKDPICSSSPYSGMRPRTSTVNEHADGESETIYRRPSTRKLITCDTSTLNSGERLEMRSLPTHPSVHDLKVLKKCHEIQESAGEAMVSGTNSEDEGCSASSDEIASSVSTSSGNSGSTSSLNHMKNSHMSLEEVLLLDKINSLNGTPMEVSWSDDAEVFTNGGGSTV